MRIAALVRAARPASGAHAAGLLLPPLLSSPVAFRQGRQPRHPPPMPLGACTQFGHHSLSLSSCSSSSSSGPVEPSPSSVSCRTVLRGTLSLYQMSCRVGTRVRIVSDFHQKPYCFMSNYHRQPSREIQITLMLSCVQLMMVLAFVRCTLFLQPIKTLLQQPIE